MMLMNNKRRWKGGRSKTKQGYIIVRLFPDDFFYPMTRPSKKLNIGSYVFEHRLVMAKHLGRRLQPWELVHHKNGIKDDNRLENLELISDKRFHMVDLQTKRLITQLRKQVNEQDERITKLEDTIETQAKLIKLLQWQNKCNSIIDSIRDE